jgi:hypothetical protein
MHGFDHLMSQINVGRVGRHYRICGPEKGSGGEAKGEQGGSFHVMAVVRLGWGVIITTVGRT